LSDTASPTPLTDVSSTCLAQAAPHRNAPAGSPPKRDIALARPRNVPHVINLDRDDISETPLASSPEV
jgi:hypothetical protein